MAFSERLSRLSGPAIVVTVAATLLAALGDMASARIVGVAGLLFYLAVQFPRIPPKGRRIAAAVFAVVALCLLVVPDPAATLWEGITKSAFLVSFFAALGLLREAAETSPTVRRGGSQLLDQPPGRRYLALTFGSHLFGMVLNYGAVALVGAMIKSANTPDSAGGDDTLRRRREERMMMAMYRGFASAMAWSPLSVMPVVVLGALPMLNWLQIAPLGLLLAVCFMLLGWMLDRVAGGRRTGQPPVANSGERWTIHLRVAALVAAILGAGLLLEWLLQTRLFIAMVLVVPVIVAVWLFLQYRNGSAIVATRNAGWRFATYIVRQIPDMRTELTLLTMSGVVGTALAAAVPGEAVADFLAERDLPGIVLPLAALWAGVGLAILGTPPLISVTFLSAAMPEPALLGVAPVVLAGAYMAAWGLAANRCPMVAPAILLARFVGQSSWHIMSNWNGRHTLLCLIAASAILAIADGLVAP